MFKDLQPPEKSGLQYKSLVLILKVVYECIVSFQTSFIKIKSYSPFLEVTFLPYGKFSILWSEKVSFITKQLLLPMAFKSCVDYKGDI